MHVPSLLSDSRTLSRMPGDRGLRTATQVVLHESKVLASESNDLCITRRQVPPCATGIHPCMFVRIIRHACKYLRAYHVRMLAHFWSHTYVHVCTHHVCMRMLAHHACMRMSAHRTCMHALHVDVWNEHARAIQWQSPWRTVHVRVHMQACASTELGCISCSNAFRGCQSRRPLDGDAVTGT